MTHLPTNFGAKIYIQSGVDIFFEIQDGGRRHLGFSSYVNLAHFDVLIVWCLSSVTTLVQISLIVTKIDALMLQMLI